MTTDNLPRGFENGELVYEATKDLGDGVHVQKVMLVNTSGAETGGYSSTASFTPTAAAYLANDTMDVAKQFAGIGPAAGGEVLITCVRFEVDHTAVISGETSYDLHLYSVTPPSAFADNAAWDLPAGDRTAYRGKISLGTPVDLGSTLYVEQAGLNKQITVPAGGSLYGYLVTVGAFTPTAAVRKVVLKSIAI